MLWLALLILALTKGELALKINGATFSLDIDNDAYNAAAVGKATGTAEGLQEALLSLKTDELGVELREFADVNVTENGVVTITAKGTGDASNISIVKTTDGATASAVEAGALLAELGLATTIDFAAGDTISGTNGTAAVVNRK